MKYFAALALLAGCSTAPEATEPTCAYPVPVSGKLDARAPGYLVGYDTSVTDPDLRTSELSHRLGFEVDDLFSSGGFYASVLPAAALARLRCEPGIRYIEHNQRAQIGKVTSGS